MLVVVLNSQHADKPTELSLTYHNKFTPIQKYQNISNSVP